MEKLPIWAYIVVSCLFCGFLGCNAIWFYVVLRKIKPKPNDRWFRSPTFWKAAALWSYIAVIVGMNGVIDIIQTEDHKAKFAHQFCAVLDAIASFLGALLAFRLFLQVSNYGSGIGFMCSSFYTIFKWVVVGYALSKHHKETKLQMYGSMTMLLAMSSYFSLVYDLVIGENH